MKKLIFILLSVFIVILGVFIFELQASENYNIVLKKEKLEDFFQFNKSVLIDNNEDKTKYFFRYKYMSENCPVIHEITINTNYINHTNITDVNETDCFNVNYYINDTLKLTYQINNTDINFAYTCADGYTNKYSKDKTFDYGCFTDTKECTADNLKDCIGNTTDYKYLNIDTNNFEEILDTINFSEKDAYLVKDNNNIYTLYFYKPIRTECCFDNDNSLINTTYKCSTNDITANTNPTSLFTDKFAPCSKIIAQVNKADCQDITNEHIIADTKTCYGGPANNLYVEDNEIKQCPVIASTTNHNYDYINGSNSPDWNKGQYNFGAFSCKFYGKNHTNKTGFCDNGGQNCLYFDNTYEIGEITICNTGKNCYKPSN